MNAERSTSPQGRPRAPKPTCAATAAGGRDALVVCPTEYGGQLEHAADLALALLDHPHTERVWLVSRPGAREYLGWGPDHRVRVIESIPPRRTGAARGPRAVLKAAAQVLDLVREHAAVRAAARCAGPGAVLALDSTKYPLPGLLCAVSEQHTAVFVHNAKPHFDADRPGVRGRVLLWLERSCARHADAVITHGEDQARILRDQVRTPVTAVDLPISTRLGLTETDVTVPAHPYTLCIGEMRANKGIELAMEAAVRADVPLVVRGAAESPQLSFALAQRAAATRCVDFADEFLTREQFSALIQHASVVVLPYTHFDAHSGVLAKAMAAGVAVVGADLASLCAQAGDYPHYTAVDVHDTAAFGSALRRAFDAAVSAARAGDGAPGADAAASATAVTHADWEPSATAVLSAGRR